MHFTRLFLIGLFSLGMLMSFKVTAEPKREKLVFSGPYSAISYPLIHMMETNALGDIAHRIEFIPVSNPDQARLMALGKGRHQADFMAMPSNVAAILHNKGVSLRLISVPVWGLLWVVSQDGTIRDIKDLKGQEIAIPYRGDMPDIVFQTVASKAGLDVRKDIRLRYTAHPLDAMQLLMMGQVKHALLAEPGISMALRKNRQMVKKKGAAPLHRAIDIQQAWGAELNLPPKIPQLSLVATASVLDDSQLLRRFYEEYQRSLQWSLDNPQDAGKLVAKHLKRLTPQAIADSLQWTKLDAKEGKQAQPELENFYRQLMQANPKLVGGALPEDAFYYSVERQD